MELTIRKHDQRSWRSVSTVWSAVRWSSLRSINSREGPRTNPQTQIQKTSFILLHFLSRFYISYSLHFCNLIPALHFVLRSSCKWIVAVNLYEAELEHCKFFVLLNEILQLFFSLIIVSLFLLSKASSKSPLHWGWKN